jgi:hypothetical protein
VSIIDGHARWLAVAIEFSGEAATAAAENIFEGISQRHQFGTGVRVQGLRGGSGSASATPDESHSESVTATGIQPGLQHGGGAQQRRSRGTRGQKMTA